jgi:hypothetical protein
MQHIDYDGISEAYRLDTIISLKRLMEVLHYAIKDGEISPTPIDTKFELCPSCEGRGGHSRRFGAITAEDFAEWDEESRLNYINGKYDERCEECNGDRVIEVLCGLTKEAQEFVDSYIEGVYEDASERAYERRMGL